jgi:hypothetical protein
MTGSGAGAWKLSLNAVAAGVVLLIAPALAGAQGP